MPFNFPFSSLPLTSPTFLLIISKVNTKVDKISSQSDYGYPPFLFHFLIVIFLTFPLQIISIQILLFV